MEAFLDWLLAWLLANVQISSPAITWVLGDPGVSAPTSLPLGYVPPLWDNVAPLSNGVDMDTFAVPILVVDDLAAYGAPIENTNAPGTFEQPGYRRLMQYGQAVREALRNGGAGITLEGVVATSGVPTLDYVWLTIDKKAYRAVRVALLVQQRRPRGAF
jgi:hypothetical protein